jgi:hypothetical protein
VLKKIDFSGNSLGTWGIELLARLYIRSELDFVEIVESEEGDVPEDLMREHSEREDEAGIAGQGTKAAQRGKSLEVSTSIYTIEGAYRHIQAPRLLDPNTTFTPTQNLDATPAPVAYVQFHISSSKKLA